MYILRNVISIDLIPYFTSNTGILLNLYICIYVRTPNHKLKFSRSINIFDKLLYPFYYRPEDRPMFSQMVPVMKRLCDQYSRQGNQGVDETPPVPICTTYPYSKY